MSDQKENIKLIGEKGLESIAFSEPKSQYMPAIIAGIITAVLFIIYFGRFREHPPGDPSSWGDFGDFIGGLMNPVVGIVTIILLVRTLSSQQKAIHIQREELSLQRNELILQRQETARSAKALDAQYRAIQIQSFEQTLFKWLDSYKQSLNEFKATPDDGPENVLSGLEAVGFIYSPAIKTPKELRDYFSGEFRKSKKWVGLSQDLIESSHSTLITRIDRIHKSRKYLNLTRSIRIIYGLLRWIASSEIFDEDPNQRQLYANIIRAQLSENELTLLFFYGLTPNGEKLAQYINKLAILDNFLSNTVPITALLLSSKSPYTQSAFGDREPIALRIHNLRLHTVKR